MLRAVLGVALAAALLAAVTPALDDARTTRTERLADRELDRVAAAAETLAGEEAPGARRTLTLALPGDSPTEAPLSMAAVGGVSKAGSTSGGPTVADTADRDVLVFGVAGGRRNLRRVEADLRVVRKGRVVGDGEALVLRGGATYDVTLRLRRLDGRRTVVVSVAATSRPGQKFL